MPSQEYADEGKRGGGKKGFPAVGWRRGLGQNENTKEKSNMDFTLDFDVVAYK